MTDQPVTPAQEDVSGMLRGLFPDAEHWEWLSALRLRAEGPQGVVLVAIDADRTDLVGQWLTRTDADHLELANRVYGKLLVDLNTRIGRRIACEDGTPARADHDIRVCAWCGAQWDAHRGDGTPE